MSADSFPAVILLFSGKRKSGKDYVTDILLRRFGPERASILRLSAPLKGQYAKDHGLDLERLLDASEYKEKYRADMIRWGESKRNENPLYFINIIAKGPGSEKPVWIISDSRRQSDVKGFISLYGNKVVQTVRVRASEEVRISRGWVFTPGIDDAESECGLDTGVTFDFTITNDGDEEALDQALTRLVKHVQTKLKQ